MVNTKITYLIIGVIVVALAIILIFSQGIKENNQDGVKGIVVTDKEGEMKKGSILNNEVKVLADGTKYTVHPSEILAGGPAKDGIPSIDNPEFTSTTKADSWLNDDDLILGLDYNGIIKAYPHRIMNWHEIVNDFAGEKPVLVTYCPLCRTGISFDPTIEGKRVEFGTSGKLWKSNLVMYDRKTDTYWSQVGGKAIIGELAGMKLKQIPMDTATWKDWKELHPDTLVLSKKTGFFRNYDTDPYSSFGKSPSVGFGVEFDDNRLFSKAIVYGVLIGDEAKAYSEEKIKEVELLNEEFAGAKLLVVLDPKLNVPKIFNREINGDVLEFSLEAGKLVDNKNREWTFNGESEGLQLERIDTFSVFWFSWLATYPETDLFS